MELSSKRNSPTLIHGHPHLAKQRQPLSWLPKAQDTEQGQDLRSSLTYQN